MATPGSGRPSGSGSWSSCWRSSWSTRCFCSENSWGRIRMTAELVEAIRFDCDLPPVALRRNRETRVHNYRAKLVRAYQEMVWCEGHEAMAALGATFWMTPDRRWTAGKPWG